VCSGVVDHYLSVVGAAWTRFLMDNHQSNVVVSGPTTIKLPPGFSWPKSKKSSTPLRGFKEEEAVFVPMPYLF
jgi:hypothetical protein